MKQPMSPEEFSELKVCQSCSKMKKSAGFVTIRDTFDSVVGELCAECFKENYETQEMPEVQAYKKLKSKLLSEFGNLMLLSEQGVTTNRGRLHLRIRKKTIEIRNLLKDFRNMSIGYEKFLDLKTEENDEKLRRKISGA